MKIILSLVFFTFLFFSCENNFSKVKTEVLSVNDYRDFKEYWNLDSIKNDQMYFTKSCDSCHISIIPELGFDVIIGFNEKKLWGRYIEDDSGFITYFPNKVIQLNSKELHFESLFYKFNSDRFEFIQKTDSSLVLKKSPSTK